MSAMDKMWASFYAIGFMIAASLLITFARAKTRGVIRFILSCVAFVLLAFGAILMFVSIL